MTNIQGVIRGKERQVVISKKEVDKANTLALVSGAAMYAGVIAAAIVTCKGYEAEALAVDSVAGLAGIYAAVKLRQVSGLCDRVAAAESDLSRAEAIAVEQPTAYYPQPRVA